MKVTPSPLVSKISGKTAGVVAASWKGRNYVRKLVTPANPKSTSQTAIRNSMAKMPAMWRALTDNLRKAFNTAAAVMSLAGWNLWTKQNRKSSQTNGTLVPVPHNSKKGMAAAWNVATGAGAAGTVSASWTDPADPAYTKITHFVFDATQVTLVKVVEGTLTSATPLTISGLTPGTSYNFYAALYNPTLNLYSEPSAKVTATSHA